MAEIDFRRNVFINCPFDREYEPTLQAILFTIKYLEFEPRIATEISDSGENRLEKIRGLIETSIYSIHDLSRCQSTTPGEMYRLNMPFELGLDYGCRRYFGKARDEKRFLILEEKQYRYQAALSDIAGFDIEAHEGNPQTAMRKVCNWLVALRNGRPIGSGRIWGSYQDFQAWHWEQRLQEGYDEDDIREYPTGLLLQSMTQWFALGRPL